MIIKKVKLLLLLSSLLIFQGCFDFGEEIDYEKNSDKGIKVLTRLIGYNMITDISDVRVYENSTGIDPYYFSKFKIDSSFINSIIDTTWVEEMDRSNYLESRKVPNWFDLTLDSNVTIYQKEFIGGLKRVYHDSYSNEVYFTYFTH